MENTNEIENINTIQNIFNTNINTIKLSHPNLYSLWNNYIIEKKKSLIQSMKQFNNIFDSIRNINDLSKEQIIILYEIIKSYQCNM